MGIEIFLFVVLSLVVKYTLEFSDRRRSSLVRRARRLRALVRPTSAAVVDFDASAAAARPAVATAPPPAPPEPAAPPAADRRVSSAMTDDEAQLREDLDAVLRSIGVDGAAAPTGRAR